MTGSDRRTVVVTGASSGIGLAASLLFAERGDRVVGVDRAVTPQSPHEAITQVSADVGDERSIRAVFDDLADDRVDVVCINAGVFPAESPLEQLPVEDIEQVVRVNLLGSLLTARAAIPVLRHGASIVLTSSTSGLVGHPFAVAYSATKSGQLGLMRSLAAELAPRGIRVNAVCPGGVDTPLARRLYSPDELAQSARDNPMGRLASAEDVAHAIAFLASPEARHINAVALRVDGGDGMKGTL
jgi:NAD(P)-dependent dehydrogenase (short-subunit alcohol dehydrogenase family)